MPALRRIQDSGRREHVNTDGHLTTDDQFLDPVTTTSRLQRRSDTDDELSEDLDHLSGSRNGTTTEVEDDEEEEVEEGPLSSRRKSLRNASIELEACAIRVQFRKRLLEAEAGSTSDLELLYPPSLWKGNAEDSGPAVFDHLQKVFLSTPPAHGYTELRLQDFCVYNSLQHTRFPGQYESLHTVASEQKTGSYLVDGIIRHGDHNIVLTGAEIREVNIGGLQRNCHSCQGEFWIRIKESGNLDHWLRLIRPLPQYKSWWSNFVWLANLVKYCIDFLTVEEAGHRRVTLDDFRSKFLECMSLEHGHDTEFANWKSRLKSLDTRRHLTHFASFIYDQSYSIEPLGIFQHHPLWQDIGCFISGIPKRAEQTIVTRRAAMTFLQSFPRWGASGFDLLRPVDCSAEVEASRQQRMRELQLPDKFLLRDTDPYLDGGEQMSKVERTLQNAGQRNISVECPPEQLLGKMVVVRQLEANKEYFDFALVTSVNKKKNSVRVVWLTLPNETICAGLNPRSKGKNRKLAAHYPIGNELFISDDCNCFSVSIRNIVGSYPISVFDTCNIAGGFFVIKRYEEESQCFKIATKSHLSHTCHQRCSANSLHRSRTSGMSTRRRHRVSGPHTRPLPVAQVPTKTPLTNLSLFSGCGMLDRALESSGELQTNLSIEYDQFAIRSAKANGHLYTQGQASEFIADSVNVVLHRIMTGKRPYPRPGCLSAGCPCPGFSLANTKRHESEKSLRDCTLLASTMSWIEVTLPAYVVIENVPNMDAGSPNACSQAISFLVALGYQVRKTRLKAPEYGGCTIRERLFILAAAPAYQLPDTPVVTHGSSPNLEPELTIRDAVSGLSGIHNDTTVNVEEPYHIPLERLSSNINNLGPNFRDMLHRIPTSPPVQGLVNSKEYMTDHQQAWIERQSEMRRAPNSNMMKRVDANGLFYTVTTRAYWRDCNQGRVIHYDQDRLLSLEEIARAQGIPRDFVLVGSITHRSRQIGNAVPWCLREAIGRVIAKSYRESPSISTGAATVICPPHNPPPTQSARILTGSDEDDDRVSSIRLEHSPAPVTRPIHSFESEVKISSDSIAKDGREPQSRGVDHSTALVKAKVTKHTSLRETTGQFSKTRQSERIKKRSRSATACSTSESEEQAQRQVKRHAAQLGLEAIREAVGGSYEDSSDDNDELIDRMSGLGSEE